ncbi:MAG: hypothetical protein EAX96_00270 [Candidatus Lokiarchaeota archaeon]|nr:hypothetical protein [Candidatus Lokiarchaeota archaeon]
MENNHELEKNEEESESNEENNSKNIANVNEIQDAEIELNNESETIDNLEGTDNIEVVDEISNETSKIEIPAELDESSEIIENTPSEVENENNSLDNESLIPTAEELKGIKMDEEEKWKELPQYLEAIFFQLGKPITERELVEYFEKFEKFKDIERVRLRWGIRKIIKGLEEQKSSIILINPTKDFWSYQLDEHLPDYFFEKIQKFLPKEEQFDLEESRILTEVAYRQPVKASEISKIIGYSAMEKLTILENKGLISMEKDKQTFICNTTEKFAELYGFDSALRNLKIQLVWRLKKSMKSEMKKDKEALELLKQAREKYEN